MRKLFPLGLLTLVACGGSIASGEPDPSDAVGEIGLDADARDDSAADVLPDGNDGGVDTMPDVGLDGGPLCVVGGKSVCDVTDCPQACSGVTCVHAWSADVQSSPVESSVGYCRGPWPDSPGAAQQTCEFCKSQDALCVNAGDLIGLVCTTSAFCSDLLFRGFVSHPCVYTDKSDWHSGDVIPTPACPTNAVALGLCGGACGACGAGQACAGRSPSHPFGYCTENVVAECRVGQNDCPSGSGSVCGTFTVAAGGSQALSDRYGLCMPSARCQALRAGLPGGFRCDGH